jgi:hypothetical protein
MQTTIEKLEAYVSDNCEPIDLDAYFREMIDECYSFDSIGGPFKGMLASTVLEKVDPIAFRTGLNDFRDSEGTVEIGDAEFDGRDVETAREKFIDALESELLESEQFSEADRLRSEIETAKRHTF